VMTATMMRRKDQICKSSTLRLKKTFTLEFPSFSEPIYGGFGQNDVIPLVAPRLCEHRRHFEVRSRQEKSCRRVLCFDGIAHKGRLRFIHAKAEIRSRSFFALQFRSNLNRFLIEQFSETRALDVVITRPLQTARSAAR